MIPDRLVSTAKFDWAEFETQINCPRCDKIIQIEPKNEIIQDIGTGDFELGETNVQHFEEECYDCELLFPIEVDFELCVELSAIIEARVYIYRDDDEEKTE